MQKPLGFARATILAAAQAAQRSPAFLKALGFVLDHEGVYWERVEGDPGGATCCGVTQTDYDAYRHRHILPVRPVAQITALEVAADYYEAYALPVHFDGLVSGDAIPVAIVLIDTAVNVGVGRALAWLNGEIGLSGNQWTADTSTATWAYIDKHGALQLALGILHFRRDYYNAIGAPGKSLNRFLTGWLARCDDLEALVSQ